MDGSEQPPVPSPPGTNTCKMKPMRAPRGELCVGAKTHDSRGPQVKCQRQVSGLGGQWLPVASSEPMSEPGLSTVVARGLGAQGLNESSARGRTQNPHPHSGQLWAFRTGALPQWLLTGLLQPSPVKSQPYTLSLMHGCEPHFPVICSKKGFYFLSGERSPLKKVQSMLEGNRLSAGIHLIHFTSCTLLNPEPEVCLYV